MPRSNTTLIAAFVWLVGQSLPVAKQPSVSNKAQADLSALAGVWQEVSRQRDGLVVPAAQLAILTQTETGEARQQLGERVVYEGKVSIDTTRNPKAIDYLQTSGASPAGSPGDVRLGIYEIDGDRLRICLARAGAERPKTFDASAGTGLVLSTYERRKN
jgi:uncharacterized protein (TIGR03067 family)